MTKENSMYEAFKAEKITQTEAVDLAVRILMICELQRGILAEPSITPECDNMGEVSWQTVKNLTYCQEEWTRWKVLRFVVEHRWAELSIGAQVAVCGTLFGLFLVHSHNMDQVAHDAEKV